MRHLHLVQVRVPRAEFAEWRRIAAVEERTLAALVRFAVREHLQRPRGERLAATPATEGEET